MSEQFYRNFNQSLMEQLNPFNAPSVPAVNTEDDGQFTNTAQNTGLGTLIVQVTIARGSLPVQGATVTITDGSNPSGPLATLITDNSGQTEPLSLPAPSANFSQTPNGTTRPYSVYNIRIENPGYYPEQLNNVPVFDKIASIQPVSLIPLAEGEVSPNDLNINESQSPRLRKE